MRHHIRQFREDNPKGFTLLEVIVCLAVLAVIMVPLTAAFIASIQRTNEVNTKVGASADAQRIASWWTKDVHNVEANGYTPLSGECPAPAGSTQPAVEQALVTFEWDTATSAIDLDSSGVSRVIPKKASWVIEGQGATAELVRRYCEDDVPKSETFVAGSFWKANYDAQKLVHGPDGYGTYLFCNTIDCTIAVSGNFNYQLTVDRRVTGVVPPTASTPPPPTITGCVGANATVTVAWLPSVVPDGLPPVDAYNVIVTSTAGGSIVTSQNVNGAALSALMSGLVNGNNYWIQVQAHNENGWGLLSDPFGPCAPAAVAPGAPINVTTVRGNQQITVNWDAPTDNGGTAITTWRIRTRLADTAELISVTEIAGGGVRSGVVTGLTNGAAVTATVSAVNAAGEGPESLPSDPPVIPCGVPDAPPKPSVNDALNQQTRIVYTEPSGNGCAITEYRIYSTPAFTGSPPSPWSTGNPVLEYLTPQLAANTAYRFQVAAVNEVGEGPLSPLTDELVNQLVPLQAPGDPAWEPRWRLPQIPGNADNLGGLLTWIPLPDTPEFNGGSSITGYRVRIDGPADPGNSPEYFLLGSNVNQFDIGNFVQTLGSFPNESYKRYAIHIAAKNDIGYGPEAHITVTAGGRPLSSPGNVQATGYNAGGAVRITWDAVDDTQPTLRPPVDGGGLPLGPDTAILGNGGRSFTESGVPYQYEVHWGTTTSNIGATPGTRFQISGINNRSGAIGGLTPGNTYYFRVVVVNKSGRSIPLSTLTVVAPGPLTAPAGPITVSRPAGTVGNRLLLNFPAFTASSGTPTPSYSAACTSPGETTVNFTGLTPGDNTLDNVGLVNGKPWTCTVTGVVSYFDGSTSTASKVSSGSATPYTTPSSTGTPTLTPISGGKARISWTAPASNGGSALTGYTITSSPAVAGFPATVGAGTLLFDTPNALLFGTPYTFTVVATNAAGDGPSATSAPISVSSSLPAQAPTNLAYEPIHQNQIKLTWTPVPDTSPGNGGTPLTGQTITLSPAPTSGSATVTVAPGVNTYTYTTNQQQTPGTVTNYTATVAAMNVNGIGPSATLTPVKAGGAPLAAVTGLSSEAYNAAGGIRLNWTPVPNVLPNTGGKSIDGYSISWSTGGGPFTAPYYVGGFGQTGTSLGGFTPGTAYTFRVYANNQAGAIAGDSAVYAQHIAVAPGPPTPVAGSTLTQHPNPTAFGWLVINFPAWTMNSGSPPVSSYSAQCTSSDGGVPGTFTGLVAGTDNNLTGLTSMKSYTCTVTATTNYYAGPGTATGPAIGPAFPR